MVSWDLFSWLASILHILSLSDVAVLIDSKRTVHEKLNKLIERTHPVLVRAILQKKQKRRISRYSIICADESIYNCPHLCLKI